jgi:peroxiredoxin
MWPFKKRNNKITAGMPAPDFSLIDTNDNTVRLSDYYNKKNVVLVFARGFM